MTDTRETARHLPLRPRVYAILLCLAEGPRHGYAVMRALQEDPVERWVLGPATLYRTLAELEAQGFVREFDGPDESGGPPRKYYELTALGRQVAVAEYRRMEALVGRARGLLHADS